MSWFSKNHAKSHKAHDALAQRIVTACQREAIQTRTFSVEDYALLPAFNWDVSSHEESAAIHVVGEPVSILHVVSVLNDNSLVYRAKTLIASPSILEFRDDDWRGFSVSFVEADGGSWQSDCNTGLAKVVAKVFSKDSYLTNVLFSSGHSNVNIWLESFDPVTYMAINTGKRYSSAEASVDFVKACREIANRIQTFPDDVQSG